MTWTDLPDSARVWVYTADRQLTAEEVSAGDSALATFVEQWTAHRRELLAYGDIVHGRFLRLAVDDRAAGASGCSIDASVRFVRALGERIGVDFFQRMTFFVDNGKGFLPYPREAFAEAYAHGEIGDSSPVVDPLVDTKAKFEAGFIKPLAQSWHSRMV